MPIILVGGLAILLTAFVAYGLAFLSRSVAGGQFGWLTGFLAIVIGPIGWVAEQVTKLTSWLTHAIGSHFAQVESHAAAWLGSLTAVSDYTAQSIAGIAYDLGDFSRWLVLTEIPKLIKAIPTEAHRLIHYVTTRVVHIERTIVKLPGLTKAEVQRAVAVAIPGIIAHDIPYFEWLKKHLKSLERILAGATAGALGSLIHLPRDLIGIRKRLGKIEKLLAGGLGVGLVVTALTRLGLNWIRCNNWRRIGREVCAADPSLISELFGLGLTAAVVVDFRQIVKLAQSVEHVTAQGIHDILNA